MLTYATKSSQGFSSYLELYKCKQIKQHPYCCGVATRKSKLTLHENSDSILHWWV